MLFSNLLKPVKYGDDHMELRSISNNALLVPKHRTSMYSNSFSVEGPSLCNTLPSTIRNANTLHTFKRSLKAYLMED